jgi:hypothetical protein
MTVRRLGFSIYESICYIVHDRIKTPALHQTRTHILGFSKYESRHFTSRQSAHYIKITKQNAEENI